MIVELEYFFLTFVRYVSEELAKYIGNMHIVLTNFTVIQRSVEIHIRTYEEIIFRQYGVEFFAI